ncbi:hypothetical protein SRB5_14060 [Streptomyces sp. RB5]|uniref:4'-phosphopantetheinyl transferase domain-containing protein n=1 Tax=Streptomyces smaragdinus TaxID=2585196 RepID=A0A7K0CCV8_9ACTN|nr:hypothetical protein [Streptomyces smaragdinus]
MDELRRSGDVYVWSWSLSGSLRPDDLLLQDDDLARVRGLRDESHAVALARTRAGTRRAVGGLLGVDPRTVLLGRRATDAAAPGQGPPELLSPALPLSLSLARTDGIGVLAVSAGGGVGVDVETVRPIDVVELADVVLTPFEYDHVRELPPGPCQALRYLRCWTRKEAVVKGAGQGLLCTDLARLETRPDEDGPVTLAFGPRREPWTVHDVPLPGPWVAAAATAREPGRPRGRLVMC